MINNCVLGGTVVRHQRWYYGGLILFKYHYKLIVSKYSVKSETAKWYRSYSNLTEIQLPSNY